MFTRSVISGVAEMSLRRFFIVATRNVPAMADRLSRQANKEDPLHNCEAPVLELNSPEVVFVFDKIAFQLFTLGCLFICLFILHIELSYSTGNLKLLEGCS